MRRFIASVLALLLLAAFSAGADDVVIPRALYDYIMACSAAGIEFNVTQQPEIESKVDYEKVKLEGANFSLTYSEVGSYRIIGVNAPAYQQPYLFMLAAENIAGLDRAAAFNLYCEAVLHTHAESGAVSADIFGTSYGFILEVHLDQ